MAINHLFVSDMDGTLLDDDSRVSPESARIISDLSRRGALVTVATARTPASVGELLADTYTSVPAVVMTGAALWDRSSERYIHPVLLPAGVLPEIVRVFVDNGVNPFVYLLDADDMLTVFHSPGMNGHEERFYADRRMLKRKRFVFENPASAGDFSDRRAILLFGMDEAAKIYAVAEGLRRDSRLSVSCYRDIFNPSVANVEVFGAGVSKAAAIRRLAGMVGADRITVYGDNLNDLPMFSVADDSVAVANAVPEVLAAADRRIGRNTDNAVALDIMRIYDGCVGPGECEK